MKTALRTSLGKLPEITLAFWIVKILATTLGEIGGDAVSMSMDLGYLVGTGIFALAFAVAVTAQVRARAFHPSLYWATIVASTTLGTTLADYATRSLGIGYAGGSALLLALLSASLIAWWRVTGTLAVERVSDPRSEWFYWITIMCSQTLGTALADWVVDTRGLGYAGAMVIFGIGLLVIAALSLVPRISRTALFWSAFILTRPFGAVVGDFLDKPIDAGGLALSRFAGSLVLVVLIAACLRAFPPRAAAQSA